MHVVCPYFSAEVDAADPAAVVAALHYYQTESRKDKRNRNLPRFGQWLAYRREIQQSVAGATIDYWQAPFQTAQIEIGDCEDLADYFCNDEQPGDGPAELGFYAPGGSSLHAVVGLPGRRDIWYAEPDVILHTASGTYKRGECGLFDPAYWCGMEHPYGPHLPGSDPAHPRFALGSSRESEKLNLIDRLRTTHLLRRTV